MKVALANPPFSKIVYGKETALKSITPCLGLFYLEAYCRDLADFAIFEGEFYSNLEQLSEAISSYQPDILGVTTNTSTFPLCVELAKSSSAKIKIAGGPYSSFRVEESLQYFDLVLIGDSEDALRSILLGVPYEKIPGIAYKDATGAVRQTSPGTLVPLDSIPHPDHRKMQIGMYQASPHRELPAPFATMMTTRGCGFACSFCLSSAGGMNGGKFRERSVAHVTEEIKILTNEFGVQSIQFWDDTFTMRKQRTREMAEALAPFKIQYVCNTRTDKMDEETAELLWDSGCRGVFFGVETGDQFVSEKNIFKNVRNSQVEQAINACRAKGIKTTASFILGSIDDTAESIDISVDFAEKLNADYALFNVYTAHPGTAGYRDAVSQNILNNFEVDIIKYLGEPAGVPTICRNLTRKQLHIKKAEAYIRFYKSKRAAHYDEIVQTYQEELELLRSAD